MHPDDWNRLKFISRVLRHARERASDEDARWSLGNLVIIRQETRLYQSGGLIPLGANKISVITAGLEGDRDGRRARRFALSEDGSRVKARRIDIFDCNLVYI
jgi:hypothetical protein